MRIDVRRKAGEISPLWFGHNLEHTRSCLWQGLSAQLIRNRKFTGSPGRDGVARHWHRIGPPGCLYLLERSGGKRGMDGRAYTAHFDADDHSALRRQRIQSFGRAPRGIGQRGIHLIGGREYEGRLALLSDRPLPVRVRILEDNGGRGLFETTVVVDPAEWAEQQFSFVPPAGDDDASLEITFDAPGVLCVGAASLMVADHFRGMRRDVIGLLKEIGVPILRWPGGNFAGSYRWKDGLLPVDRRAPLRGNGILPHTGGYDDHEIGTDEFTALCRELNAEPWITINMGVDGAAADAAAWVEYCNGPADTEWGRRRAELGNREPYNVKYWSLGNEMGWPHMKGPNEPREYASAAAACAAAMKEADPSIVLVASDGPDRDRWYTTVPAEAGDCFDHISYHEYTDPMKVYEGRAGKSEFRRIAAAAGGNLQAMKQIRGWLDSHAPGGKSIGISFDEWNVWHAWFRVPGVVEGIHAAAMLNMFCREARNVGMTFGAYFEPVNEGAILVAGESCKLTPAGQVFAIFTAHHGNELIEIDAGRADVELDVAASVDEAASEVILTLVNLSPDRECEAEVFLENIGGIIEAGGTLLTSKAFLPESEFSFQELPVTLKGDLALAVGVPPHSVARVQVRYRQQRAN